MAVPIDLHSGQEGRFRVSMIDAAVV